MFKKIIKNFILYSFSFVLAIYLHTGSISFASEYDKYYAVFIIAWGLSTLLSRKFKVKEDITFLNRAYTLTISLFLMLGILAVIIYKFNLIAVSRFVVIYSVVLSYVIELNYLLYKNKENVKIKTTILNYSIKAFSFEVVLFGFINLYLIYQLTGSTSFNLDNLILFFGFYLSWFVGSFAGHQFHPAYRRRNYIVFIWQYMKSYVIILALTAFSAFMNRFEINEVQTVIYGIIAYSVLSFTGISFFYYVKKYRELSINVDSFSVKGEIGDVLLGEKLPSKQSCYKSSFNNSDSELLNCKLKNLSLKRYPEVFEFLDKSLDLNSFDNMYSMILKSDNISNIDFLPDSRLQLFLNLEKINKIHNINDYFTGVNNKLMEGGIFAGNFETVYLRHQEYMKSFPYYFAQLFYFLDFIWNRVFSKIFILKNIYSAIMAGTNKILSLAEGLGRLYFCGFEVLNLKIIGDNMFFIAKKRKEPIVNTTPSTGLIFKMKRIGKNGKPIYIYKLRTMHPYAEYLQEFIYEKFKLQNGGKFKNDFRITYWGKILRKLWLDELPMIYNWFKGDLKLVGFRPLSLHYFNLYKEELKQKRMNFKPGLVPPFYADVPKTFDEIMESEERYLNLYEKKPLTTDLKYLFRCIYNILFKGARSS